MSNFMGRTIFITGAAGYVGEMLCEQFALREDVERIIALDKLPQTESTKAINKLFYIEANLADNSWQEEVAKFEPDTIIHTAWQIRALYGNEKEQWRWNVVGSENVFTFAFANTFVSRLVYFSTASSYGARTDNTLEHYFTEAEGFRDDDYIYALEKKTVEECLEAKFKEATDGEKHVPQIFVLRPAAVTGPRGRYLRNRFGLQSALQGNLQGGFMYRLVTTLTAFFPATPLWARQFIHEDDVTDIVTLFTFDYFSHKYQVFNITPTGEPVLAADMAGAVKKKVLPIYPWMARVVFFVFWHLSRGKVPTCPGSWRFYSYPILMSGDKLAIIYTCQYSSKEAFQYTDGRYEAQIPVTLKKSRPIKLAENSFEKAEENGEGGELI